MNFLITGAGFVNKGAQSMLFTTVDQILQKHPDAHIFVSMFNRISPGYKFTPVYCSGDSWNYAHGGIKKIKAILKSAVKSILHYDNNCTIKQYKELVSVLDKTHVVVNISGYALSSDWNDSLNFIFLEYIRQAKKRNIPVYLMPQSYGPFQYSKHKKKRLKEIVDALSYCKVIFARENAGMEELAKLGELKQIKYSPDLVLQSKKCDSNNIYIDAPKEKPEVSIRENSVAIIPSTQILRYEKEALSLFRAIIDQLLITQKHVYLLRHTSNDIAVINKIKMLYSSEENVTVLDSDYNCFEFSAVVSKFDFVIGSRYHAIVHALKNGVPCIALGWATKYEELLQLFDMKEYSFNVRDNCNAELILNKLSDMSENFSALSSSIKSKLNELQAENCFDVLP